MALDDNEALGLVHDFLESHPERCTDSLEKAANRFKVVDDPNHPGKIVFEVERHRAWFEEQYITGNPMDSYITYWDRFSFDPSVEKLERIGVIRPSEFHIGCVDSIVEDFSFEISKTTEETYLVTESKCNLREIVANLSEAEGLAEELVRALNLEGDRINFEDALAPNQWTECEAIIKAKYVEELKKKIREAWAEFQGEQE
jgi:hypothetical protein